MKKSILLFAVALGMLTSCDPIKDSKDMDIDNYTSANLLDGATFEQFADQACTTPAADGNWIKYNIPNASSVFIYYVKADGSEFKLASGAAGGVFNFVPARGSDPLQTVYFKYINANLEEVIASKEFTVAVAAELKPEVKYLASNQYGKKTWKWDTASGIKNDNNPKDCVWGNFGADGNWRGDDLSAFLWWGVSDAADLTTQLNHSVTGEAIGEEDNNASMVFTEDGLVKCYDANGVEIRSGSYEIKDWTGELNGFKYGILHTSEGATLFPYEINAGGKYVTDFWIFTLNSSKLVLVYPDNGEFSGWSEGTYWAFSSDTDVSGMISDYGSKTWTWDTGSGIKNDNNPKDCVWGNFGADGNWRGDDLSAFLWWGVSDAADLTTQLNHSVTGEATGEESNDATMVLTEDGLVKCYDASGKEIRSGSYEIDLSTADGWKKGTLKTSEGAMLFPFEINAGGRYVTDYQIWKISDSQMVLTYPDNGSFSGWSEGTYWAFKKK